MLVFALLLLFHTILCQVTQVHFPLLDSECHDRWVYRVENKVVPEKIRPIPVASGRMPCLITGNFCLLCASSVFIVFYSPTKCPSGGNWKIPNYAN